MNKKVAYFTNIAPHYREKLWLNFANNLGVEFHFFFGERPDKSIKGIDFESDDWKAFQKQIHKVGNVKFKKAVIFQTGALKQVAFKKWDAIVMLGDANILSNWIAAIVAKIRGIPIILWGHGLYGSENWLKRKIRLNYLSLADINLVYGHWAKNLIIQENFNAAKIKVIYNSLDYDVSKELREKVIVPEFYKAFFDNTNETLIFIGRLTKIKKLHLLLQAVNQLMNEGKHYNLMMIGDGEEKEALEELAKKIQIKVHFLGACYDEEKIARCIANAALCVSPGNVGLTAVHAMSYGTPVCTNNNFKNQMPEFEAIQEWETGCFFDQEKHNLAETIAQWFAQSPQREKVRQKCYARVDHFFNPYNQTQIIKAAIEEVL